MYQGAGVYDEYVRQYHGLFLLVEDIKNAQLVVVPADYKHYKNQNAIDLLKSIIDQCIRLGKWVLLFYKSDQDDNVRFNYERLLIFRTSFYKSTRRVNEFAMPVWSGDVLHEASRLGIKPTGEIDQVISFCGQGVAVSSISYFLGWIYYSSIKTLSQRLFSSNRFLSRYYSFLRQDILSSLERSSLKTAFVVRDRYFGGAWRGWGKFDLAAYKQARLEYLENMVSSQFVVCIRGGGNYSLRFYEALSLGKIPILIDTDCVLPFDDQIDWDQHCIVVPVSKLGDLQCYISDWLKRSAPYEQVGQNNRELWENWLSPESFFSKTRDLLSSYLIKNG